MDAVVAAAGSADSIGEEAAISCSEKFLSRLAKLLKVPTEVITVILMSFGCFLDSISDITFQLSLAFIASGYYFDIRSTEKSDCGSGTCFYSISIKECINCDSRTTWRQFVCEDDNYCEAMMGTADKFDAGNDYGGKTTSSINLIARILLGIVVLKEFVKLLPFLHIYVSPHFHNPANFQTLHNSSGTWIVLLFSKRWQQIAKDSLAFEKKDPAIIHILADVLVEDLPQFAFTVYLLVIGLQFPCFLANTDLAAWNDITPAASFCSKPPLALDDGTECYTSTFDLGSNFGSSASIFFHDNGDIEEKTFCYWDYTGPDPNTALGRPGYDQCKEKFPWDVIYTVELAPRLDLTYMNQCSSPFSSQSVLPFCSCSGFGGGGIDGLMVFSLLMTLISTAAKLWKLMSNIKKRHQNIEEAYANKASRGESGGISAIEMNKHVFRRENPAVGVGETDFSREEMEGLLANMERSTEEKLANMQRDTAAKLANMERNAEENLANMQKNIEANIQRNIEAIDNRLSRVEGGI